MKNIEPPECPWRREPLDYVDVIKTHAGGFKWNSKQGEYEWNNGEKTIYKCPNCHKEVDVEKLQEDALKKGGVLQLS